MSKRPRPHVLVVCAGLAIAGAMPASALGQDRCAGARDLRLVNGRIVTMDARNSIVPEVVIQDGRFETVGRGGNARLSPCTKVIDLRGRTAVPGLIDNHNHIVLLGIRPGHDTRLETAASIADVQAAIRTRVEGRPRRSVHHGDGRMEPRAIHGEASADARGARRGRARPPRHRVPGVHGPRGHQHQRARRSSPEKGVAVTDMGAIAANAPSIAALGALRAAQTIDDRKRGTLDAMAYSASVGVTTNVDMGAFLIPGLPDIQESFTADTLASADPFRMYDAFTALHREQLMTVRLRVFFLSMDTKPDVPMLKQRLLNSFNGFGDDMLRVSGIGEFATSWPLFGQPAPTNYVAALQLVAKQGWPFQQHSLSPAEDQLTLDAFETVNRTTPIAGLRWSIAHVPRIDLPTINRFKALGAGIAVHPFGYLAGAPGAGPPLRTIVDSGIHVGAGSDSAQISTLDPWLMIYYMVTGKNSSGTLINSGQQLTRMEALRLYTSENGWFFHEEDKVGTIAPGKLGDVVVLSDDYFDARKVSDEAIKQLKSVLTVVDGRVVYDTLR